MAIISIDDSIYSDYRFINLAASMASVDMAIGSLVLACMRGSTCDSPANDLIPVKVWVDENFSDLIIDWNLAEKDMSFIRLKYLDMIEVIPE